ncbi:MAG TPA: tetratricopeptide repeat protein, partial [Vicinamibacteria bacterium]|nr:tetratricopeptide repeat protein [Vicinamibacteria bacterium]
SGSIQMERGSDEDLLSGLEEMIAELGRRPNRIEVRDPTLARLLSDRLGNEIDVVPTERLEGVERFLDLFAKEASSADIPGALDVAGVTVEAMRRFAEAARAFCEAAPWRHLTNRDLIEIRAGAPPGLGYAVVLGNGRSMRGIGFFDNERTFWDVSSGQSPAKKGVWHLGFDDVSQMPLQDAELWVENDLEVADDDAYPVALCIQSRHRIKRPSPRVLDFLTGLMSALAESRPEDLDKGKWERSGYGFTLPFLLQPPAREELVQRGILPDPRVFERLHFLLARKMESRPDATFDDLRSVFERELTGMPLDEIPFEPRTDAERAQEIFFQALDAWGRHQIQLVHEALQFDPACVDALVLQAELAGDVGQAMESYGRALEAGKEVLESGRHDAPAGELWNHYPARPFLRALHGMADLMAEVGDWETAIACYTQLLALDRSDHQGVRYELFSALFAAGQFKEAEGLAKAQGKEAEPVWTYGRALAIFAQVGDKPKARKALEAAISRNPLVAEMLLDFEPDFASDEEDVVNAQNCVGTLNEAWEEIDGALDWLYERYEPG